MTDADVAGLPPSGATCITPLRTHASRTSAGIIWCYAQTAHYPSNGFCSNCGVETLNESGLRRMGKEGLDAAPSDGTYEHIDNTTGEVVTVPNGVLPGWDYAPGQTANELAIASRLNRLDNPGNTSTM
mgnify:FL=1